MAIEHLDPRKRADVDAVADIHLAYLADSPVVRFGERFLREFYYTKLVEAGLIGCTVCRVDGRVVGFISYTRYPLDFMTRGLRRWPFRLARLLLRSVIARPAMVRDLVSVLALMLERGRESRRTTRGKVGEVLSLAVVPEYRNHVPPDGTDRVTVRLFRDMVEYFRRGGFESVYLLVQPRNVASNIFCSSMGCEFEKVQASGMSVHRYTYRLDPARETPREVLT